MADHHMRWREYMDDLEDVLRSVAVELERAEKEAARDFGRETWPLAQRRRRRHELLRRALDMPFLGELLREAATEGLAGASTPRESLLRPWSEPDGAEGEDAEFGVDPRAVPPPPPGAEPPARLRSAERVLRGRSRSLVPVLDGLRVPRNASAVVRTAEGLGLHEVHFVHPEGSFRPQRAVTKRAERWLDLRQAADVHPVLDELEGRGYRILAADFGPDARPLDEVPLTERVAVVLGSEQEGVRPAVRARAHDLFHIPVDGFTSYLNVSVAAAISLYELDRRQRAEGRRRPLEREDRQRLRALWYRRLARGRREREASFLRWLHRPPAPLDLRAVVPSRERRRAEEGRRG